jgi:hypothetical protein
MNSNAVKELMYGGIYQLMKNKDYYYYSSAGSGYSNWTDTGKQALLEYINLMAHKMMQVEEVELNQRAKDLVVKGLKGEKI